MHKGCASLAHPPKSVADIVHLLWVCSKNIGLEGWRIVLTSVAGVCFSMLIILRTRSVITFTIRRNNLAEVFCKKGVIISQNSQESTCIGVGFLIKLKASSKFCEFCAIFKNTYFEGHLQTAAY